MATVRISATIDLPTAETLGKINTDRWFRPLFGCGICGSLTTVKGRHSVAGAHICRKCADDHNATVQSLSDAFAEHQRRERAERISAMHQHADVSYPDSHESPGAVWLLNLWDAISEAWDSDDRARNNESGDVLSELADSAIPVYTHNRWQIFTDLCAYDADVEMRGDYDNGDGAVDMTGMAGEVLCEIAYAAMSGWLDEKREESRCNECGDLPEDCYCDENEDENEDSDNENV